MYKVKLRDTRDGFTKTIEFKGEYHPYLWEDGNYECDCNRSIFLYGDEDKELPCNLDDNIIVVDEVIK